MWKLRAQASLLITGAALMWGAQAQTIYRCGNSYSQVPCPGAVPMDLSDLSDTRQKEQREQTQAAAQNDARLANTLEKERLAEEKRQLAANLPDTAGASKKISVDASDSSPARDTKRPRSKHKKKKTLPAANATDTTPSQEK